MAKANSCVYCQAIIPEDRMICPNCEYELTHIGRLLQSIEATEDQVQEAYKFIEDTLRNKHD